MLNATAPEECTQKTEECTQKTEECTQKTGNLASAQTEGPVSAVSFVSRSLVT